jgi:hypothetical protein
MIILEKADEIVIIFLPYPEPHEKGSKGRIRIPLEPSNSILLENPFHKSSRRINQKVLL